MIVESYEQEKMQYDIIWIVWELLIIKCGDNAIKKKCVNALLDLFSLRYTAAKKKARKYMLYFALELIIEKVSFNTDIMSNKSIGNSVSVSNQSITHSLAKFIPDFLSSLNQSQMDLVTGAKINELIVSYRLGVSQNSGILKSIYTVDKMKHYLPLISRLRSLHLPYLQPLEEGLLQQTNVTFSSFFYPNVPISSEYYKYFELFLKKNLPSQSKPDKKRKKNLLSVHLQA